MPPLPPVRQPQRRAGRGGEHEIVRLFAHDERREHECKETRNRHAARVMRLRRAEDELAADVGKLRLTLTGHPATAVVLGDTPEALTDEKVGSLRHAHGQIWD
jgi:hypothetical protein